MGLEKRRHVRYGVPDATALGLIILAIVSAVIWARSNLRPAWEQVSGTVVSCDLVKREYGNSSEPEQVRLSYRYEVQGRSYTGSWDGFWPQANSPNALPRSELARLRSNGYPLTVAYDPDNPAMNSLHRGANTKKQFYPWITAGFLGMAAVYFLRIYPRWKRHAR